MLRFAFLTIAIIATTTIVGTLLGTITDGGASLGAVFGAAVGTIVIAARLLADRYAIAAARRDPGRFLQVEEFNKERARHRRAFRRRVRLKITWGAARFLRETEEEREALENHPSVKRLYSQHHHDLNIRDIPGASHLARKRKRKR